MLAFCLAYSLRTVDYQECGDSVVGVDFPAKSVMDGAAGVPKGKVDFLEVDRAGKQNDATIRKSTRLKKPPNIKKQDFL
jgi:hypothetical protein